MRHQELLKFLSCFLPSRSIENTGGEQLGAPQQAASSHGPDNRCAHVNKVS